VTLDVECTAVEAVERAMRVVGQGQYLLGCGDYAPYRNTRAGTADSGKYIDLPWTSRAELYAGGARGSDCWGLIAYAWKTPRHRPGFNTGAWASVSDDMNCDSVLEDAQHKQEWSQVVDTPQLGDLVITPTIRLYRNPVTGKLADAPAARGASLAFYEMGHVRIVVSDATHAGTAWDPHNPCFALLDFAECRGPNFHEPGVVVNDGRRVDAHNANWPKPQHRAWIVRPHARVG
jgi:hypothetical protein